MPHIVVKMYPGRPEAAKVRLAEAIVREVMQHAGSSADSISVAIEEVSPSEWAEKVYRPEIQNGKAKLYKKPGYSM